MPNNKGGTLIQTLIDRLSIAIVIGAFVFVLLRVLIPSIVPDASFGPSDPKSIVWFWRLVEDGQWIGPKRAPIVILVYSDYSCGYCQELHETLERLQSRYPEHVAVVIKQFVAPISLANSDIALGAECAGDQNRFAAYHAAVFADTETKLSFEGWLTFAEVAHVPDIELFEKCVRDREHRARIAEQFEEGRRLGVEATPTLYVNGVMIEGAIPFEELNTIVTQHFPRANARR